MNINVNGQNDGNIEVGDLVKERFFQDEESVGIVTHDEMGYNVVIFDVGDNHMENDHELFTNHTKPITLEDIRKDYVLVAKSKNITIDIKY